MNTYPVRIAMTVALAALLPGCLEIETTTRVHPDGRLTRTVVVSGDSSDFSKIRLRTFGLDSGWTVVSDSSQHGKDRKLTLQREFESAESASRAYAGIPLERQGISFNVERRFRWFTTLYRYEETWQKGYRFEKIPLSNYLSPEEIRMVSEGELKGPDSLLTEGQKRHRADLEKRTEEWLNRNSFEEVFQAFLTGVRTVNDPRLSPDSVLAARERLYTAVKDKFTPPLTPVEPVISGFDGVLKTPVVSLALEAARPMLERHDRAVAFMKELQVPGLTSAADMPGIITGTNGTSVEGNTVRWKDIKDSVFYLGYTMWAESRMVNWWAVVVTAFALLGIGGLLVVGLLRRRPVSA